VWHLPAIPGVLERALVGLVAVDELLIERGVVPSLYESGVRYRWVKPGNGWDHAGIVYARGYGDCKDVGAWRCAELRLQGVDARCIVVQTGPANYHVQVQLPSGDVEDPSVTLLKLQGDPHALSLR